MQLFAVIILEASDLWPVALAGLGVLTAAVVWIYPPQVRGNGVLGWIPLLLRWMALAVLAIALLRPVLFERNPSPDSGSVMILVDCSKSMGVSDTGRTPAQRVALAAALGKLPEGVRSGEVAGLGEYVRKAQTLARNVLSAQSDLDYARVSGRGVGERQTNLENAAARYADAARQVAAFAQSLPPGAELRARLVTLGDVPPADSREAWSKLDNEFKQLIELTQSLQKSADEQLYAANPQVRLASDGLAKLSRVSLVQEALLDPRSGLVPVLLRRGPVAGYAIRSDLETIVLVPEGRKLPPSIWQATAPRTDLTGAVARALDLAARTPVKAIVLFSDGREVGGNHDMTSAVRPSGVPVITVDVSSPRVPDAWISAVSPMTGGAFAGESIEGQIEVRARDLAHLPEKVTVSGSLGRQEVALTPRAARGRGGVAELTARYSMPVGPTGVKPLDKLVFSIPAQNDEVTGQNNRVERWVKVSSEQVRVLLCAGEPTWDFQYLRNALSARQWVRLESVVVDAQRPRLEMTPGQILQHDVVMLSDVPVGALDVNQWDAINRVAVDRGGCVVVIAGVNSATDGYTRQPIARGLLPFHDLRPTWKQWPGALGAFRFVPTPLGESEMLRLGDRTDDPRRWQELPGVFRYLQLPEKNLFPDVRMLLTEADGGSPVLTERALGDGRVFFFGLDETWRWRRPGTNGYPDRFWQQLVRHAAGEPYLVSNGGISLDVSPVACEPGDIVTVRARIRGGGVAGTNAKSWPLEIVQSGKGDRTATLQYDRRGRFEGKLRDLPEGDYELRIRGTGRSSRNVASVPLHIAASDEAELSDISGDPQQLSRIARATGGEHLTLDEIDRLPGRLSSLRGTESEFVRRPLYSSPLLFVFVLSCLAGEWALRKRHGLA
jgi:hypothetical protein